MFFLFVILVIVVGDGILKGYMEQNQKEDNDTYIWKKQIKITMYHNKGIALNILEKNVQLIKIVSGTVIGILMVLLLFLAGKKNSRLYSLGLSLILGGAISNFMDRMQKGYVVDYFSIMKGKKLQKIVFNLSDFCVFLGSIIIIFTRIIKRK